VALLAAGFWLPANAELAQHLLNRAWSARPTATRWRGPWLWADTASGRAAQSCPIATALLTVLGRRGGRQSRFAPALLDGSAPTEHARRPVSTAIATRMFRRLRRSHSRR
jgi:hypothetical protein